MNPQDDKESIEKQIRTAERSIRHTEEQYRVTQDPQLLVRVDELKDQLNELTVRLTLSSVETSDKLTIGPNDDIMRVADESSIRFHKPNIGLLPRVKAAIINRVIFWWSCRTYVQSILEDPKLQKLQRTFVPLDVWEQPSRSHIIPLQLIGQYKGDLLHSIDEYDRVIIFGETGTGKTSSLRRLMTLYAQRDICPIYVPLALLEEPSVHGMLSLLMATVQQRDVRSIQLDSRLIRWGEWLKDHIEDMLISGRTVLLLDGINEIKDHIRQDAINAICEFLELPTYAKVRIILTSRPLRIEQWPAAIKQLFLRPLTDQSMIALLHIYKINGDAALRRLETLDMKEVYRSPDLLDMFADLYQNPDFDLPLSQGKLFQIYVKSRLVRGRNLWKPEYRWRWINDEVFEELLGVVAFEMINANLIHMSINQVQVILRKVIGDRVDVEAMDVVDQAVFCETLEFTINRNEVRFRYDMMMNFFAAIELERRRLVKQAPNLDNLIQAEQWWEALLLQSDITVNPLVFAEQMSMVSDSDAGLPLALRCAINALTSQRSNHAAVEILLDRLCQRLLQHLERQPISDRLRGLMQRVIRTAGAPISDVFAHLIDPVHVHNPMVRELGIELIATVLSENTIDILITALTDPSPSIGRQAAQALIDLTQSISLLDTQITRIVGLLHDDRVYRRGIEVILQLPQAQAIEVLHHTITSYTRSEVRASIYYLLYRMGAINNIQFYPLPETFQPEEEFVITWLQYRIRRQSPYELMALLSDKLQAEHVRCLEPLIDLVMDTNTSVALLAINRLKTIRDIDALSILLSITDNHRCAVELKLAALDAAYTIHAEITLPYVVATLNDEEWKIQKLATDLIKTSGWIAVPYLLKQLDSRDIYYKSRIIYLLGELGNRQIIPQLTAHADDDQWSIRYAVAYSLGRIGDYSARSILELLKNDRNQMVRRQAMMSLDAINGGYLFISEQVDESLTDLCQVLIQRAEELMRHKVHIKVGWRSKLLRRTIQEPHQSRQEIVRIQQGLKLLENHDYQQAVTSFQSAIDINKENAFAHLCLAHARTHVYAFDLALEDCKEAKRLWPDVAIVFLQLGLIYMNMVNIDQALVNMERAAVLDTDMPLIITSLGQLYSFKGQFRDAEICFRQVIDRYPKVGTVYSYFASLLIMELRPAEALIHANTGVTLNPRSSFVRFVRAVILQQLGYDDQALNDMVEAIESSKGNEYEINRCKAFMKIMCEEWTEAIFYCREAERRNPYDVSVKMLRLSSMIQMDQLDAALDELNELDRSDQKIGQVFLLRSFIKLKKGQLGLALADLQSSLVHLPGHGELYLIRVDIYLALGYQELVWQELEQLMEISPFSSLVHSIRGYILILENKLDDALKEYDWAIKLAPNSFEGYLDRAWCHLFRGDVNHATEDQQSAMQRDSINWMTWQFASSRAIAQGDLEEAKSLIASLSEHKDSQSFCQFKRAFFLLSDGQIDAALEQYAKAVIESGPYEIKIALLDLDLAEYVSAEGRNRAAEVLKQAYTPGLGLLNSISREASILTTFL